MAVRPRIPFVRQVLVLQVGVVVVVASLGYGLVAWMLDDELRDQYGQRALTVARSVAADPAVAAAVAVAIPAGRCSRGPSGSGPAPAPCSSW